MNIEEPIERLKLYSTNAGLCLNGGTTCIVNISDLDWLLTAYEKEKEKNKELESDKEQLKYEIDCLKNDIKNMYCEEAVITIIEDNFDLSREKVIQILGEE